MRCPYSECPFEGTQQEVDEHVTYVASIDDPDHTPDKYVGRDRERSE